MGCEVVQDKCRTLVRQMAAKKKNKKVSNAKKKGRAYKEPAAAPNLLTEPEILYTTQKQKLPARKIFEYKKFTALAAKIPFTLKEWAAIIYLSDRTLQRYASENKPFEGIYADRLLQIEKVIQEAGRVFTSPVHFYTWLKEEHTILHHTLSPASLQTQDGIQLVLDELGRIQQGVYI